MAGVEATARDMNDDDSGRGRGKGDASGKLWQQEGDWLCLNTRSVMLRFSA